MGDSAVQRSELDFQDHTFRMFDRKDLNSIMVTPSFGDSLKSGAIKGATFGGLNIQDDKGRFTAVTLSYLEKELPNEVCNVDKAEILIDPQWVLFYTCKVKTGN